MSILSDLINQIDDANLKERISKEVDKLAKQKKFGLVFEEHQPECTPLYEMPIKVGSRVAKKDVQITDIYTVVNIEENSVECLHRETKEVSNFALNDLVVVAEFGEAIYPYLKPLDSVCNAPDSDLWHTLIEADNYHALQLLEYLYAGKVDCIYIDPPYNTGAKDWKYNNDYVDGVDQYRHSKWLSMMQKRLKIAKKLLNPKDSVLIVTIDEKEYLHLGCLLEEMFPEARMQMVSSIIKPEGTQRSNEFSRTNEFLYFLMFGDVSLTPNANNMFDPMESSDDESDNGLPWRNLRRRENRSIREKCPNQFYPFFIDVNTGYIKSIGDALPKGVKREEIEIPENCYPVFPLTPEGREMTWGALPETARSLLKNGYIMTTNGLLGASKIGIKYLTKGVITDIENGVVTITGKGSQGEVCGFYAAGEKTQMPKTIWNMASHNAQVGGSLLIKNVIGDVRFTYPKSLYAVHDAIHFFVANKKNALVIDFFAGSGTTLHAVNLLNAEDGGKRRCIVVTNNEVSVEEAKELESRGCKPGDEEWNNLGIARYVTWPRTVCSIIGKNTKGELLKGNYLGTNEALSNGFKTNAIFFQLGFLDKNSVALGRQFKELLPVLWMKAGAVGKCPNIDGEIPDYLICPENKMAVLINEQAYMAFVEELETNKSIETLYIVTDSEAGYREMINGLEIKNTYQLYRDYLDNFRINSVRR